MSEEVHFIDLYEFGYEDTDSQVFMARHLRFARAKTCKSRGFFVFGGKDGKKKVVELYEYQLSDGNRFQDRIVKNGELEVIVSAASFWQVGLSDQILEKAEEKEGSEYKDSLLACMV